MKNIKILILLLLSTFVANGQNTVGKTDDFGRIALSSVVSKSNSAIPTSVYNMLENKLSQIATSKGLGGSGGQGRFIIAAKMDIVSKDIITGPPAMVATNVDITIYIADVVSQTKFAATAVSLKGVGTNDTKALTEAVKLLNANKPEIQAFVEEGKNKIIEFFNSKCDFLIKEAQALESQNKFEEAIYKLLQIPDVSKDCYNTAMEVIAPIYKKKIERDCQVYLLEAKGAWAATQDSTGARKATSALAKLDPQASCYNEAKDFLSTIDKAMEAKYKREWDFQMKVWQDGVDIEKQRIEAYRQVGVAFGSNYQGNIYGGLDWLFR